MIYAFYTSLTVLAFSLSAFFITGAMSTYRNM